jgi:hypothetical protein
MLVSLARVFERLPRQLMPRLMIPFFMMYRRGPVRMGGKLVEFSGFLVRIIRHDVYLTLKTTYISTVAQVESRSISGEPHGNLGILGECRSLRSPAAR